MKQKLVLIVDDDPDIVLAIGMVLQGEGYLTEEASDGAEGIARMRANRPDW